VKRAFYFVAILFGILACLTDCSKNGSANGNPIDTTGEAIVHVSKIRINDSGALLFPSLVKQLSVTITPATAFNIKINWRCSDNAVATVDGNGMVTGILQGSCYIVASSADNPFAVDSIRIYVLKTYDVYVAGVANVFNNTGVGAYWHNGVFGALDHGYSASAITVSNNDVYITGTSLNQYGFSVATYWKNGQVARIFDTLNDDSHAASVAVAGDTAYIAGWDTQYPEPTYTPLSHAHYWKCSANSIVDVHLYDGNVVEAYANAISLSNGNVYVAGTQANDNFYSISKYWINNFGQSTALTNTSFAQANGIAVQGTNVYVAGDDGCPNYGCVTTAKVWMNNLTNAITLTDGTVSAAATSVAVSGNTIYAAGYEYNLFGRRVAKLWMVNSGSVEALRITDGKADAMIKAITIVGDDIFLAGFETDNSFGYRNAKYWRVYHKLVLPIPLISGYPESSEASGIFVQ